MAGVHTLFLLVRLELGLLASSTTRQKLVYPDGFDFRLLVLLSLQSPSATAAVATRLPKMNL
uniref:Secreted protein n=1 Tax=Setaria italica TaxID=4555 RepID=K4AN73_SETIT